MRYGTIKGRRQAVRTLALAAAIVLFPACADPLSDEEVAYARTPLGYPVRWEEEGSTGSGYFSQDLAFRWYEEAVERACDRLARYGVPREQTREVARRTGTWLIDNYRRDGWAGINNMRDPSSGGWIKVCLYRSASVAPGEVRPTEVNGWPVPPWTHYTGPETGKLYFGYIDETKGLYPALGHEIGHSLFGPDFEHTYYPPTVARASTEGPRWTRDPLGGCTPPQD